MKRVPDPMRRRGPAPDPEGMTSGSIQREMDALHDHDDSTSRMIAKGWGDLTGREIDERFPDDPDVIARRRRWDRIGTLQAEARARYGPDYRPGVCRLPTTGGYSFYRRVKHSDR